MKSLNMILVLTQTLSQFNHGVIFFSFQARMLGEAGQKIVQN